MAQFVKRRVANPAPSVLALVNKTRSRNMAAKKKSSSKKRPSGAAKSTTRKTTKPRQGNPAPKKRTSSKSHSSGKKHTSRKPRRGNPLVSGETGEILRFAGAGFVLGLVQQPLGQAVGRFLPLGAWNAPVITAGSSLLLGWVFNALSFTRGLARPVRILGVSAAVLQGAQLLARGIGGAQQQPPLMQAPRGYGRRGQMGAIGVVTDIPPRNVPLPPAPPANAAKRNGTMAAIGASPGRFRR